MKKMVFASMIACFLIQLVSQPASGVIVEYTLEQVAARANQVVVGEISNLHTRWNRNTEPIYTEITVSVLETWKGDSPGKTLTFDQIGGVFGDTELIVPDAIGFEMGEKVILFIDRGEDFTDLAGWFQGKFNIEGGIAVQSKTGRRIPVQELKNIVLQSQ